MTRHLLPALLLLHLAGLILGGCSWIERRRAIRRCEFQLSRVEPVDYSILRPLHLDLLIEVSVRNPNDVDALLEPFRWQLLIGDRAIARGRREESISIPSGGGTSFTMEVEVHLWEGTRSLIEAILDREVTYRLPAVMYLSTPFGDIEYEVLIEEGRWTSTDGLTRSND